MPATTHPPFNSLGEPLGGVTGLNTPWYVPRRDMRPCACGCGEPFEPLAERSAVLLGDEWRWVHKGHGTMARSKRTGRHAVPLMATGESAGEWKAIEREQAAEDVTPPASTSAGAAAVIGTVAPAAPASSDDA